MVTIILLVVVLCVGLVNHQMSENNVKHTMESSISTSFSSVQLGSAGNSKNNPANGNNPGHNSANDEGNASGQGDGNTPSDTSLAEQAEGTLFIPVAVYRLEDSGALTLISQNSVSISDDVLTAASDNVSSASDGFGKLSSLGLYYMKSSTPGGVKVAFADKTYVDANSRSLLLTMCLFSGIAWLAFFVISIFLSRWATKPVKKAWEQQSRFVADASHELKTPLTVILANNSILMSHPSKTLSSQIQWVESTQSEAELMQTLVNDLLFLAKPETEEEKRLFSTIDFSELVNRNLLQFESVAFEKRIELASEVETGLKVKANETRLQRLVGTLIDNACKYAEANGKVMVTLTETAHKASLCVSNTGPEISPDDLPYIFDRFYRADKARTRDNTGYGLGLSIAKEVAEELGGSLQVGQREGYATTFVAQLPIV